MIMKREKKGDISAAFLITVILGVLACGIVLIVYSQFSWTATADKETCHQSVIYRATLPSTLGAKAFVPLKCKTEKICFTSGIIGGKCNEFENVFGITRARVNRKEQIEQEIARKMVDCWEMTGQGKLSLFNQWFAETYGFSDVASSCIICSRIAFDRKSLAKTGINVQEIDVFNYMTKHLIAGKNITYYDYLGGDKGKISVKDENVENLIKELSKNLLYETVNQNINTNDNPNSDELAILFMQIYSPKYGEVFKNSLYTVLGIGASNFISAPVLSTKLTVGAGKLALAHPIGAAIAALLGLGIGGYQAYSVFNNNAIAAGYCGDIAVEDRAETGCSVVRIVNYGAEDLSKYCSTIESIA